MGKRGPAPEPTIIKLLKGNPGKRPLNTNEPRYQPDFGKCPADLPPGAAKIWRRVAPQLKEQGLLSNPDREALAAYCVFCDDFNRLSADYAKTGSVLKAKDGVYPNPLFKMKAYAAHMMLRFAAKFGFTPSDRTGLTAPLERPRGGFARFDD